jgi:hypothetical protein
MLKDVLVMSFALLSVTLIAISLVRYFVYGIKFSNDPFIVLAILTQALTLSISNLQPNLNVISAAVSIFSAGMMVGLYLARNPLLKKA